MADKKDRVPELKNCQECERLRMEVARLRDAVELLACQLVKTEDRNPRALRAGRPLWTTKIPKDLMGLWRDRK